MRENYRNTTQIANYCKEKVGFDTVPIGLQGESVGYHKFTATSIKKAFQMLIISKLKRKAIIINQGNEELYNVIVKQLPKGSYQSVQQGDEQVTSSKIFILSVEIAKGLEFDDVLVFTKGMNKNSKYIAFTRALNHLSVVGSI